MADSAANLAMDTRTSTQVHFPTHRAACNNLTQDLDNDVMHWLMRSSEDPRSLDNTRQPHIGPREHAILVKDYLAVRDKDAGEGDEDEALALQWKPKYAAASVLAQIALVSTSVVAVAHTCGHASVQVNGTTAQSFIVGNAWLVTAAMEFKSACTSLKHLDAPSCSYRSPAPVVFDIIVTTLTEAPIYRPRLPPWVYTSRAERAKMNDASAWDSNALDKCSATRRVHIIGDLLGAVLVLAAAAFTVALELTRRQICAVYQLAFALCASWAFFIVGGLVNHHLSNDQLNVALYGSHLAGVRTAPVGGSSITETINRVEVKTGTKSTIRIEPYFCDECAENGGECDPSQAGNDEPKMHLCTTTPSQLSEFGYHHVKRRFVVTGIEIQTAGGRNGLHSEVYLIASVDASIVRDTIVSRRDQLVLGHRHRANANILTMGGRLDDATFSFDDTVVRELRNLKASILRIEVQINEGAKKLGKKTEATSSRHHSPGS
ncbi:hypothetical protein FI667_g11073, partial [Globisporangium splendens]